MDNFDKELFADEQRIIEYLQGLFNGTYAAAVSLPAVRNAVKAGQKSFVFKGEAQKAMDKIMQALARQINITILSGIESGYRRGEAGMLHKIKMSLPKTKLYTDELARTRGAATDYHRAAAAFAGGKRGGLTLSERVWNIAGGAKTELEAIIQNGIIEGKGAQDISRSIQGYLQNPDRLYRRVRSKETGELELSDAARDYHPGRGVYRSSYKNALRLARTEINAAYRYSQWQQIQNNPLVIGFRIALSNNHTTLVKGVPTPFFDICDELAGDYPKSFLWTGWHPQCRCSMIPIPISESDFERRLAAYDSGTIDKWQPSREITDMPLKYKEKFRGRVQ